MYRINAAAGSEMECGNGKTKQTLKALVIKIEKLQLEHNITE